MIVVDASSLLEVLLGTPRADAIRRRFADDADQAAPHIIDVEVFGVVRRGFLHGWLDQTAASQAVADLRLWPGERYGHRLLLDRAWELRSTVRGWDAMYVALAEALDVPLVTTDQRLAAASGPRCLFEVMGS